MNGRSNLTIFQREDFQLSSDGFVILGNRSTFRKKRPSDPVRLGLLVSALSTDGLGPMPSCVSWQATFLDSAGSAATAAVGADGAGAAAGLAAAADDVGALADPKSVRRALAGVDTRSELCDAPDDTGDCSNAGHQNKKSSIAFNILAGSRFNSDETNKKRCFSCVTEYLTRTAHKGTAKNEKYIE